MAFCITICRPEKYNALNGEVNAGLVRGYRDVHEENDMRVIVGIGVGNKAFCAGANAQNSGATFAHDFS